MKTTKKIASILLALVLVFALTSVAFASDVGGKVQSGKITIDNAVVGQTYSIYRILDLRYNATSNAYSYTPAPQWNTFVRSADILGVYLAVDEQDHVTWVGAADDARVAEFAKLAMAYAADVGNDITADASQVAAGTTVTFDNLPLGYYLLGSSLGTLCSLDSTATEVIVHEKNQEPTVEKSVQEDSTNRYGSVNDAEIGQVVHFKSEITAYEGAKEYVFRDKMSDGLTFGGSVTVTLITAGGKTTVVDPSNYRLQDWSLHAQKDITFDVTFYQAFCDTLKDGDTLRIEYSATVNEDAVIAGDGNLNKCQVRYGVSSGTETLWSETKTYVWQFDILKYGDGDNTVRLAGAKFVLLNSDRTKVALFNGGKITGWANVPAANADGTIPWPDSSIVTTTAEANLLIQGLDSGDTYYLREIESPAGYNLLEADITVVISATANGRGSMTQNPLTLEVENRSGSELPSTGGIGTTIFYLCGSILLVGAAVLLITKKRTNAAV